MSNSRTLQLATILGELAVLLYAAYGDHIISPSLILTLMFPICLPAMWFAWRVNRHGVDRKELMITMLCRDYGAILVVFLIIYLAGTQYPVTLLVALLALIPESLMLKNDAKDILALDDPKPWVGKSPHQPENSRSEPNPEDL